MKELDPKQLRARCEVKEFTCKTSDELTPLEGVVGQPRALKALQFGLEIPDKGFNIYAAGISGTGRHTAVERFLQDLAATRPVPPDWCYVPITLTNLNRWHWNFQLERERNLSLKLTVLLTQPELPFAECWKVRNMLDNEKI